jgi:hypothetical protein
MAWSWRQPRRKYCRPASMRGVRVQRIGEVPESGRVPSPGGWTVPPGVRPAWNWTPPPGITPRPDRVSLWVRLWYYTPLLDRYAYAWMWRHGGWDVVPRAAQPLGPESPPASGASSACGS